ncbi:BPSS1187 family protein [Frondihabitans australicus]|uniref:Alpha/beta hydrolase family protein n=1 Tax=Frondihabitans australicus TaxID=386892 RepID=A0A495IKP4_9MICO|nr:hypothetical protein [Frondihabitans australicus]RKR76513.1 hypothetical protein C8E83_3690 [Frondihabitans australicus]
MARPGARVRTATLVAVCVSAILLFCIVAVVTNHGSSPAKPTASPSALGDGWLSFRLPDARRALLKPDQMNLAKAAQEPGPGTSLLVFLPATGERPLGYREFLRTASAEGFSVLGLDYWNIGPSVTRTCLGDARCYGEVQQNRFTGADPSRFSRIGPENSILDRLHDSLTYLEQHDPAGDWSQYVHGTTIDWSRIVLAGHSQGGGEAGFISHLHEVQGVLMFSSPVETYGRVSARWLDHPGATPRSRLYAFDDVHDVYHARIVGSWRRLHLGHEVRGDVPTGSHALLSTRVLGTPLQTHGRSVNDRTPLRPDGEPVFAPTWRWMLEQVGGRDDAAA